MTRDELQRWFAGHAAAESRQHELAAEERADPAGSIARSLSLIAALRATIPAEVIERQREDDDARVRAIWNRLRLAAR